MDYMLFQVFCFMIIGVLAGTLSGLFGIGGGMIVVPSLLLLLPHLNLIVNQNDIMRLAVGTSLAVMIFTSLSAVLAHQKLGSILWDVFRRFSPGMVLGSFLGAMLAQYLHADILRNIFGVFMIVIALRAIFAKQKVGDSLMPDRAILFFIANFVGLLSVLIGVGAGSICVPYFMRCGFPLKKVAGTASACSLLAAVLGVLVFFVTAVFSSHTDQLPLTTGYVYWPAFLGIGLLSVLFVPLGAKLSQKIPAAILKPIFALMLFGIGIRMIF